jgi:hypothetical protein
MATNQQFESTVQDQQPFTQASLNKITLVPFVPRGDLWSASDTFLASLYQRTQDHGLVNIVYWEGSVRSHQDFISMAKRQGTVMVFAFVGEQCAGYAWLAPIAGNYALPHFCFFKDYWGKQSREIGHNILDYWFSFPGDNGPLFDVLIGVIPDLNVSACKFVEDLGAIRLGVVPRMFKSTEGKSRRDAVFYYWTRD